MQRVRSIPVPSSRASKAISPRVGQWAASILLTLAVARCWGAEAAGEEGPSSIGREQGPLGITGPNQGVPEGVYDEVVAVVAKGELRCTGVLVASDAVLTARHCLPASEVYLGTRADRPRHRRDVVRTIGHPDPRFDVALLFLGQPLPAQPRALRPAAGSLLPVGQATLIGYGSTSVYGRGGEGRKRVTWVHLAGWGCDGARVHTAECDPDAEMVIPRFAGRDTCSGDSGAPVFETMQDRSERVLAIVSRGIPSRRQTCGQGGIYVRADRIATWVTSALQAR